MYPKDLKYDKEHEWVKLDGDVAIIGISDFAQDQLGEVVYVDLPSVGDEVAAGESFGEIESVKSVSELFSPLTGEIVEVNDALGDAPETVNEDAYGDGWMLKIKMSDAAELDELMSAEEYEAFIAEEA
ncbi:MAG: glycine cleavage system protein H [Actinobacteria bacterium HGW-Actinobacteria-1]|jgi:glycine cleavage system H protein|nr:MAG: glycine cleavage system protein H [Actinobacteria bacterium HGW-Actinobacteria-1]